MKTIQELLNFLDACPPAQEWAENKSVEEIIETCHRGDWLLWLAFELNLPIKPLTLAKARCAKTVIHLMKDQRSINAVNIAEKFGLTDEVSLEDLKVAATHAAYAYTAYAANATAAYAASAAYAANIHASPYAAACAADAAIYANTSSVTAAIENQMQTADICREIFGKMLIELVNAALQN